MLNAIPPVPPVSATAESAIHAPAIPNKRSRGWVTATMLDDVVTAVNSLRGGRGDGKIPSRKQEDARVQYFGNRYAAVRTIPAYAKLSDDEIMTLVYGELAGKTNPQVRGHLRGKLSPANREALEAEDLAERTALLS